MEAILGDVYPTGWYGGGAEAIRTLGRSTKIDRRRVEAQEEAGYLRFVGFLRCSFARRPMPAFGPKEGRIALVES